MLQYGLRWKQLRPDLETAMTLEEYENHSALPESVAVGRWKHTPAQFLLAPTVIWATFLTYGTLTA